MTNRCIKNLLKLICLLQDNSSIDCLDIDNCTRPFLGQSNNYIYYNTRVISLYTRQGELFSVTYIDNNNVEQISSIFKVISVDRDTARLLILSDNNGSIASTNNYITIKLSCIGAIRCLQDISL